MTPQDERLTRILLQSRTIALVGASMRPERPSHYVGNYLRHAGYRVIPVNPGYTGEILFGEKVRGSLDDIDEQIDLLNVFLRSERVLPIIEKAIAVLPSLKTVWMQVGVKNAEARALAEAACIEVVEDRCIKVDHARLVGRRMRAV